MAKLLHVFSSLKKKKKDMISLILLIFLAAMLLNTGLAIQMGINDFYLESNERLQAPHYVVCVPNNRYKELYLDYLQNDSRVNAAQARDTAVMYGASYEVNGGKVILYANFFSTEDEAEIAPFTVLEESGTPVESGIYVPYFFKNNGYQIGDTVKFDYNGEVFIYQVAGYFETTWFGTTASSIVNFYLPEPAYQELYSRIGGGKFIAARVESLWEVESLRKDFKQETGIVLEAAGRDVTSYDADVLEMQSVSAMIPGIMAVIMMAFAVVIFIIVFLVIRFRIYSHMEDNMKNIGVMEALGYTSRQIRWMIMLEYLIVGIAGGFPGILMSYGLIQMLGGFISGFVGAGWVFRWYLGFNIVCIALIAGLVLLTTFFYSRKVRKLTPVVAFRGGVQSHNFRRNRFSFDRYGYPLPFQLACKDITANFRQYLMVSVILAGVTAAVAFSLILYNNMSGKDSAIYKALGMEKSNVSISMARHQDFAKFSAGVLKMEEVRSISTYFGTSVEIEGRGEVVNISDDFSKIETVQVYEGTFPKYHNEIVITGIMAKDLHKKIGDTVSVSYLGVSADYIICGFTQTLNNLGRLGILSLDGIRRINPSFEIMELNVYLEEGYDTEEFIRKLEQIYPVLAPEEKVDTSGMTPKQRARQRAEERIAKLLSMYDVDSADYSLSVDGEVVLSGSSVNYKINKIDNMELFIQTSMGTYVAMVAMVVLGILLVTLFIVGLILVLVIRYMILRRRQEFGVMKAVGYTSAQIRMQIAFGFLPVSAVGIGAGCILAGTTLNSVFTALLQPMGVSKLVFHGDPLLLAALFAGLLLYVFAVAFLASRKVRTITPYELFVE